MKHFRVLADHPKGEIVSSGCDYATATLLVGLLRVFGATEAAIVHNHGPARRRVEELQASGKWFVIALGSCKACSGQQPAVAVTQVPLLQLPPGVRFLPVEPADRGSDVQSRRSETRDRKSDRPNADRRSLLAAAPAGIPPWAWGITKGAVVVLVAIIIAAVYLSRVPGNFWRWLVVGASADVARRPR
jgi:hypothetical protein